VETLRRRYVYFFSYGMYRTDSALDHPGYRGDETKHRAA
jgi:hypothetical protein